MHLRLLVLSVVVLSTVAFGQSLVGTAYPDAYQVKIFPNTTIGDSYIDITNSGQFGSPGLFAGTTATTGGSICVNVYVFASDEELMECCSCAVTPNELVELDVQKSLVNVLQGSNLNSKSLEVALTATQPTGSTPSCSGSAYAGTSGFGGLFPEDGTLGAPAGISPLLVPGLVAWGTGLHLNTGTSPNAFQITETRFEPKPLLDLEATRLNVLCSSVIGNGSGPGLCTGCTVGALAAAKH